MTVQGNERIYGSTGGGLNGRVPTTGARILAGFKMGIVM